MNSFDKDALLPSVKARRFIGLSLLPLSLSLSLSLSLYIYIYIYIYILITSAGRESDGFIV
jgi:hypothetical protein